MALTRVQSTGRVRAITSTAVLTFPSPPTTGNTVVVAAIFFTNTAPSIFTCVDNRGNTYARVGFQQSGFLTAIVFACTTPLTTGSPFTVTLGATIGTLTGEACAMEVTGGGVLAVDQTVGQNGTGTTPATGTTAALTGTEVFALAMTAIQTNQASITVQAATPAWFEEFENLDYSTTIAGEVDSRSLTAAAGTTQSCSWTDTVGNSFAALLVVFKGTASPTPPSGGGRIKGKLGNKHGRTDENGAVIVAVGATPGTPGVIGPLTVFPHLCGETTDTNAIQVTSVTAGALRTPRTPLGNLRVTTDDQGSLRVAPVTAGVIGPLTPLGNLQCRTDETGALLVTSVGAGSLVSAPSPLLNLRGRTDDQGALVVTGLTVTAAYRAAVLADGATYYWRLDEPNGIVAVDSADSANGVISGNVTLNQPGAIANGTSMAFGAGGGRVTTGTTVAIPVTFSIEAWVKSSAVLTFQTILSTRDASAGNGTFFGVNNTNLIVLDSASHTFSGVANVRDGAWHHVVITGNGTTGTFYVDGVVDASGAFARTIAEVSLQAVLAADMPGNLPLQGSLDEVAIYPLALTPTQIAAHYALRTAP